MFGVTYPGQMYPAGVPLLLTEDAWNGTPTFRFITTRWSRVGKTEAWSSQFKTTPWDRSFHA
jgi:hypothetical protein